MLIDRGGCRASAVKVSHELEIPENTVASSFCFVLCLMLESAGCVDWPRMEAAALMAQYTLMEQRAALRDRRTRNGEHSMLQPAGSGAYYATR